MLPPPGLVSPVPAQTVPSDPTATAPIAWVLVTGHAEVNVLPASVVFQTPPPAVAAYTVPACAGSTARSAMRPPTSLGPSNVHAALASAGAVADRKSVRLGKR